VSNTLDMTSNRPYLIRAIYEWLADNNMTPHLLVNAEMADVNVPVDFVEDGQIVLNISPNAIFGLDLGNDFIMFNARFGGKPTDLAFPVAAVMGIYARENGQGMIFPEEEDVPSPEGPSSPPKSTRPSLKVVK